MLAIPYQDEMNIDGEHLAYEFKEDGMEVDGEHLVGKFKEELPGEFRLWPPDLFRVDGRERSSAGLPKQRILPRAWWREVG